MKIFFACALCAFTLNAQTLIPSENTQEQVQKQEPAIQAAKTEILGEWVRTDCSTCKLVFTNDMKQKYYINGQLEWAYEYDIARVCNAGQFTIDEKLMLITLDGNGNKLSCDIIQTLNDPDNSSDILSITTEGQGKLIVYERP